MTKKTSYKCGHCGESGHNARTCPEKGKSAPKAEVKQEPEKAAEPSPEPPTKKKKERVPAQLPLDSSVNLLDADRTKPARPKAPGCFRCPQCNQVSILVLVQLPGDKGDQMRCESCHNKIPLEKILIWGAQPSDAPTPTTT